MKPTHAPRPLFVSGGPRVQTLVRCLSDTSLPPRDGSWLMGASAPTGFPATEDEEPPEEQLQRERQRLQTAQAEVEDVLQRYCQGVAQLERAVRDLPAAQAEDTVELACVLAKAIVERELELDPGHLTRMVTDLLRTFDGEREVTIRLSPIDLARLRETSPGFVESSLVAFAEDPQLSVGGCVIESPRRILDASVESRLDVVRARLVTMLRQEGTR